MTRKNIKKTFDSIEEVRKEVQTLIKEGVNFREIAKMKFQIGDTVKKFNIKEISNLKNNTINKNDGNNIDEDTAFLFKEFRKGKDTIDLIIDTKLKPDFVEGAYKKYREFQDMRIISASFYNNVTELIERIKEGESYDLDEDFGILKEAVDFFMDPEHF